MNELITMREALRRDIADLKRERDEALAALAEVERENEQLLSSNKTYEKDWPVLVHERNQWKEESLEQARLLAMSADREEKLRDALQRIAECDMRWSKKVAREALQ